MMFSIIIPSYNSSQTIVSTINSIKKQSFKKWELIIVDDGSTDNTCQIIESEIALDNRIFLIPRPSNRPKGANACRNVGIEHAKGDFVAFMDSDDAWKPNRLEAVSYCFLNNECDGLYSGAEIYDGEHRIFRASRDIARNEVLIDFIFAPDTFAPTPSLVVKACCVNEIKFDESLHRHQDYDFFLRFGSRYRWIYLDDDQVIVNWKKGSIRNVNFDSCIRFYERYRGDITNKNDELRYLVNMRQNAVNSNSDTRHYYNAQIRKLFFRVNFRRKILILFPNALRLQQRLRHMFKS